MSFLKTVPSATCGLWDKSIVLFKRVYIEGNVFMKPVVYFLFRSCSYIIILMNVDYNGWAGKFVCALCVCFSIHYHAFKRNNNKQELQEVLKFPIEIFWNLEASLKSELLYL